MLKSLKDFLYVIIGLIVTIMVAIDVWYLYIVFVAPEKVISTTFEVGIQELKDADNTQFYFMEVELWDNAFEVKFNYMLDENQTDNFSQGLQYIYDDELIFGFTHNDITCELDSDRTSGILGWKKEYYNCQNSCALTGTNFYNYMSYDDYSTSLKSTNPIDLDTVFKIQIGDELYGMKFKGTDTPKDNNTLIAKDVRIYHNIWTKDKFHSEYYIYDVNYLVYNLYQSVKSLPAGTNKAVVFEFGNLFNYYEYDENTKQYTEKCSIDKAEKLTIDVKSYYSIKVKVNEGNLQKATDSLFNSYLGNTGYNETGDITTDDYFVGRTIKDLTWRDFDFIKVDDNNYALKLKEDFINNFEQYSSKLYLSVCINKDELNNIDINFVGFTSDNGLNNFNIYECYTIETIGNEIIKTNVNYQEVLYV